MEIFLLLPFLRCLFVLATAPLTLPDLIPMSIFTSMTVITQKWRPPRLVHESYDNLEVLCEFVRVFISTFRRRTGR